MSTWLVTGTSRGIGLELVRQILANGPNDTVFAAIRSQSTTSALKDVAASAPTRVHIIHLDIADAVTIKEAAKVVEEKLQGKGLDYLINNAAIGGSDGELPSTADPTFFLERMRCNVVGPMLTYQALLPALERSTRPDGPVVLNTTTGLASIGLDCGGKSMSYSTSKTALNMLTYKQAKEKPNIIFFVMDPGWVKTDMGGPGAQLEIPFSVGHQYKQIVSAARKDSGTFKRYNGETIPW